MKRLKHVQRFHEIVMAFTRNGFGFLMHKLGLLEQVSAPRKWRVLEKQSNRSLEERARFLLEDLGATFIKLGQIASTRTNSLPKPLLKELEKLQDNVKAVPYEDVKSLIEAELGEPLEVLFRSFEEAPMATASIGQVHGAVLHSGEPVAVKVQRPGIRQQIEIDLDILFEMASIAEKRLEWAERYKITDYIEELAKSLRREVDYSIEARNTERMQEQHKHTDFLKIPAVYSSHSTRQVLTMERVEGRKLNAVIEEEGHIPEKEALAEQLVQTITRQIYVHGFYHADPHPGNLLLMEDGRIALIDFGMVGRLNREMRNETAMMVMALLRHNTSELVKAVARVGRVPADIDLTLLKRELDEFQDLYLTAHLNDIGLGEVVSDVLRIITKHGIEVPQDFLLIGKSLMTIEGIAVKLDPELSIMEVVEPLGEELLSEYLGPKAVMDRMMTQTLEYGELLKELPHMIRRSAAVTDKGRVHVEVRSPDVSRATEQFSRVGNQITLSLLLVAVSLVFSALIIGVTVGGTMNESILTLPFFEVVFIVFLLLFLWLIYSILKTRRQS